MRNGLKKLAVKPEQRKRLYDRGVAKLARYNKVLYPVWLNIEDALLSLNSKIAKYEKSSLKNVGLIVGIARGGAIPAVMYSHLHNTLSEVQTRFIELSDEKASKLLFKLIEKILKDGNHILFIDDMIDSGETYKLIKQLCFEYISCKSLNSTKAGKILYGVLYRRETARLNNDKFIKFFYGKLLRSTRWVTYPWEKIPLSIPAKEVKNGF